MLPRVRAVVRKELRELWVDPTVRRTLLIQAGMQIALVGALYSGDLAAAWRAGGPGTIVYFPLLCSITGATLAADTIAGEWERKTLETLLSTPVPERAIIAGKCVATLVVVAAIAFGCLVAATLSVSATVGAVCLPSPLMVVGALLGPVAYGAVLIALATFISLRTRVARSAQQISALLSMFLSAAGVAVWGGVGGALTWGVVLGAYVGLGLVGVALVALVGRAFQRERLFGSVTRSP